MEPDLKPANAHTHASHSLTHSTHTHTHKAIHESYKLQNRRLYPSKQPSTRFMTAARRVTGRSENVIGAHMITDGSNNKQAKDAIWIGFHYSKDIQPDAAVKLGLASIRPTLQSLPSSVQPV